MFIYKITNKLNGKIYIGQTMQDVEKRWARHCSPSSIRSAIGFAIQKYGKDNFLFEVIDTASTIDELNNKEIKYIELFDSVSPNGYNLTNGGLNYEISDALRQKLKDEWHTEKRQEIIKNLKKLNIGRTASLVTKEKMRISQNGRRHSEETKKKIKFRLFRL